MKLNDPAARTKALAEAPVPGLIAGLATPTIISMLVTSLYNMADSYFVGKIPTNSASGAVGVVFPLMAIIQAIGFFFGHGSGTAISRRLGAYKPEEAEALASCGFFSAIGAGFLLMLLGETFLEPLAWALGSTPTILPYAKSYLGVILLGAPYMTAALVMNNQMRFQGSAFFAMVGITSGAVLNVVLDPIFIFAFDMGVAGAALATILSQLVSFVALLIGIQRSGCSRFRIRHLRLLPSLIREMVGGGLPSLLRQGLASLSSVCLNLAAGPWGDAAIAALSVVSRITNFAFSAAIGFGQGFQPVCGYNFGAKNMGRVREAFWFSTKVISVGLLITAAFGFCASDWLVSLFRPGDAEVIAIGGKALRLQCVTLPLAGWVLMNNMMFQTIKLTVPASILAMARQGLFFIPAVLLLPLVFQLDGVLVSMCVSDVLSFGLSIYFNRKWMSRALGEG